MIKKMAWETFKNTGDINTYLEFKQIEEIEKGIEGELNNPLEQEFESGNLKNNLDNLESNFNLEKKNKWNDSN